MNNSALKRTAGKDNNSEIQKLETEISVLEKISVGLEPGPAERDEISREASDYINEFIDNLPSSKGYLKGSCDNLTGMQFGNSGKSFDRLLDILKSEVDRIGINSASGRHLGYIPGGGIWTGAIADMLAAASNRYAGIFYSSPGAVIIENQIIKWLISVLEFPGSAHGNLTSGGSMANLIAVKTARDKYKIRPEKVAGSVVYFTSHAHHCISKALDITGLNEAVKRIVPVTGDYKMDVEALDSMISEDKNNGLNPFMVIATAGTTDTGAIDPLNCISEICSRNNIWFHVDAAYGGFFALLEEHKEKFAGIEKADSVVLDPHKSLFIPYGSGAVIIRDGLQLKASFSHAASYMQDAYGSGEPNPSDYGPELSRHFRGLRIWLPLHLHGLDAFKANLKEKVMLCRYFYESIKIMGFQTGPFPELSIVVFRYPDANFDAFNKALLEGLLEDGRCFLSSTLINGEFWIRCAVLSFRTHLSDIKILLEVIGETLQKVKQKFEVEKKLVNSF